MLVLVHRSVLRQVGVLLIGVLRLLGTVSVNALGVGDHRLGKLTLALLDDIERLAELVKVLLCLDLVLRQIHLMRIVFNVTTFNLALAKWRIFRVHVGLLTGVEDATGRLLQASVVLIDVRPAH